MSNIKKIVAMLLAVLVIISSAACATAPNWSYKANGTSYSEGIYIYSLFVSYSRAYSIVKSAKGEDFKSSDVLDYKSTFDETSGEMLGKDWVIKEADRVARTLIALDTEIAKYNITLDPTLVEAARVNAREMWYLGPNYEYYASMGYASTSFEDMFYSYGVSFDSYFASTNLATVKDNALFNYFYGKGGIKEVPDAEVEKYFEDNFTSYAYFSVPLYSSTIDESTSMKKDIAFNQTEIAKTKAELNVIKKAINSGKSYAEASAEYIGKNNLTSTQNTEILSNSSVGKEIVDTLNSLSPGKADFVQVGEGDTATMFFVAKNDVKNETKAYTEISTNRADIVRKLKYDEFYDYIDELTLNVECEKNTDVINKYGPDIFANDETIKNFLLYI